MGARVIGQLGFVVPDVGRAIHYWTEVLGVGPFFLQPPYRTEGILHRGEASPIEVTIALAYSGNTQIELIEQKNDAPSIYREFLELNPAGGLNHVAYFEPGDYAAALAGWLSKGFEIISGRPDKGIRFAYLANPEEDGLPIELVSWDDVAETFEKMRSISGSWDGSAPIRAPIRPRP